MDPTSRSPVTQQQQPSTEAALLTSVQTRTTSSARRVLQSPENESTRKRSRFTIPDKEFSAAPSRSFAWDPDDEETGFLTAPSRSFAWDPDDQKTTSLPLPLSKTPLPQCPLLPGSTPNSSILLSTEHPLLQEIFKDVVHLKKLGEGTCWLVFEVIDHPFVVKVPNPVIDPFGQRRRVEDSIQALENFPGNSSVPLCPFPLTLDKTIQLIRDKSVLVQYKTEQIENFSSSHPTFDQVRNVLTGMALGTHALIEDFRPVNVGMYKGDLVHFDPSYLKQNHAVASSLVCYFLEWAGGNKAHDIWEGIDKSLLATLVEPLQNASAPTDLSKTVVAHLLQYLI